MVEDERAALPGAALVLVADAGESSRRRLLQILGAAGHRTSEAASRAELEKLLSETDVDVVVIDVDLAGPPGPAWIESLRERDANVGLLAILPTAESELAVAALRGGADAFVPRPVDAKLLCALIPRVAAQQALRRKTAVWQEALRVQSHRDPIGEGMLVGACDGMKRVRELVGMVAPTEATVLVLGETGTGKGIVARLIHRRSRRPSGPFVMMNCAALQPALLESELFGHERGAFTDAKDRKPGLFEIAHGGTLFLDEAAELNLDVQAKLLTVLEERTFRRVGGVKDLRVDVRLVFATHRDLKAAVERKAFRADLYYRLNVFQIPIPPLRERGDDVLQLAGRFLRELNATLGKEVTGLSEAAQRLLREHSWPGNVRELLNALERAMIVCDGPTILPAHLPEDLRRGSTVEDWGLRTLEDVEREHVGAVVRHLDGNLRRAAVALGVSRSALYEKVKRLRIELPSGPRRPPRRA